MSPRSWPSSLIAGQKRGILSLQTGEAFLFVVAQAQLVMMMARHARSRGQLGIGRPRGGDGANTIFM